jgi:hypothetical protein
MNIKIEIKNPKDRNSCFQGNLGEKYFNENYMLEKKATSRKTCNKIGSPCFPWKSMLEKRFPVKIFLREPHF